MNFSEDVFDDTPVIRRILNGDINSFEILMDRYQDHVSRIVGYHVPRDVVPEVAHDTFVSAYQSLGRFKATGLFKHWLSKIAVRCCYNFWRHYYQTQRNWVGPLPDECHNWVEHLLANQSSEVEITRIEARDLLQWALGHLSAQERTVLTLTLLHGYSMAEAAELMGWSVIRTKVQAHRSRKKLRKILAEILPRGTA
jgi:RNA polymerase sigma-70 factor (ECF subfamily)